MGNGAALRRQCSRPSSTLQKCPRQVRPSARAILDFGGPLFRSARISSANYHSSRSLRSSGRYGVADDSDGTNLVSTHRSNCAIPVIVVTDEQVHGVEPPYLRVTRLVVLEIPSRRPVKRYSRPWNPTASDPDGCVVIPQRS